jgi:hypothetical protein
MATRLLVRATTPHMCHVRHAVAICLFFGVWLGIWSAAWLAGVYFFSTETPALFGGFFGCVAGGLAADLCLAPPRHERAATGRVGPRRGSTVKNPVYEAL